MKNGKSSKSICGTAAAAAAMSSNGFAKNSAAQFVRTVVNGIVIAVMGTASVVGSRGEIGLIEMCMW